MLSLSLPTTISKTSGTSVAAQYHWLTTKPKYWKIVPGIEELAQDRKEGCLFVSLFLSRICPLKILATVKVNRTPFKDI